MGACYKLILFHQLETLFTCCCDKRKRVERGEFDEGVSYDFKLDSLG